MKFRKTPKRRKIPGNEGKSTNKALWNSKGAVSKTDLSDYLAYFEYAKRRYGYTRIVMSIKVKQKTKLLNRIDKSMAKPPHYRTLGTRCAGWVTSMLRKAGILGPLSYLYQWSPWHLRNGLRIFKPNARVLDHVKH